MKRSGFKKKIVSVKRKKPNQVKILKKKLWELCKQIIRIRDGTICVACGRPGLEGSNWHTGHFIPSSTCGAFLRYDLRNLHSSCYNCNINLGGNGAMFYKSLVVRYGQDFVDRIFLDKNIITKADNNFYETKIEEYTQILSWNKTQLLNHTKIYTGKNP